MAAPMNKARKRQYLLLSAVAILFLGIVLMVVKVTDSETPRPQAIQPKVDTRTLKTIPGQVGTEGSSYQAVTDNKLAALEAMLKESQEKALEREKAAQVQARTEAERVETERAAKELAASRSADASTPSGSGKNFKLFDPSKLGQDTPSAGGLPANGVPGRPELGQAATPTLQTLEFSPVEDPSEVRKAPIAQRPLVTKDEEAYRRVGEQLRGQGTYSSSSTSDESKSVETYLPSGTFFKVATMNGMDAPSGGQSQNNPQPMLLLVTDYGNLPNRFKADVKQCFLISQGYGDLSSERAMVRTESLSCVRANGDVIDVPVSGYLVGPDGRVGLRGRVVSKQGQVLANALWTSMLSSFGEVAKQVNSNPVVVSGGLATQQSPTSSDLLKRGGLGGLGDAAKQLSQYYITLAEKLYPVIEIDGGQTAEVVLTQGASLKNSKSVGSYSDLAKIGRDLQSIVPPSFMKN